MRYPVTPLELSEELGLLPEARAGKRVRDYLRARYPDKKPGEKWLLDKDQADDVREHFARQRSKQSFALEQKA